MLEPIADKEIGKWLETTLDMVGEYRERTEQINRLNLYIINMYKYHPDGYVKSNIIEILENHKSNKINSIEIIFDTIIDRFRDILKDYPKEEVQPF